jgi:hypothetical protein
VKSHLKIPELFQIGFIAVAVVCDFVLNEFDKILTVVCEIGISDEVFHGTLSSISNYRPNFTAARFFSVNRSMIFSVLNSFTTFLLVIVQLRVN